MDIEREESWMAVSVRTTLRSLCPSRVMLSANSRPSAVLCRRANSLVFGRARTNKPKAKDRRPPLVSDLPR